MLSRLARAWRALVNEPTLPSYQGQLVILTGPIPRWVYAVYQAEAKQQQRPIADILEQALLYQAAAIVRQQGATIQ